MKQQVRGVSVVKTNTDAIIFLLMILVIASVFCSLLVAREVSALSLPGLTKDVTVPVVVTLPEISTPGQPALASTSSDDRQVASPTSNTASPTTDASVNPSQLVGYDTRLEPMPVYSRNLQQLSIQPYRGMQPALAHSLRATPNSSFSFLQPSEQGWQIAGIAWYWWGWAGTLVWLGVRLALRWRLRQMTQKLLVS